MPRRGGLQPSPRARTWCWWSRGAGSRCIRRFWHRSRRSSPICGQVSCLVGARTYTNWWHANCERDRPCVLLRGLVPVLGSLLPLQKLLSQLRTVCRSLSLVYLANERTSSPDCLWLAAPQILASLSHVLLASLTDPVMLDPAQTSDFTATRRRERGRWSSRRVWRGDPWTTCCCGWMPCTSTSDQPRWKVRSQAAGCNILACAGKRSRRGSRPQDLPPASVVLARMTSCGMATLMLFHKLIWATSHAQRDGARPMTEAAALGQAQLQAYHIIRC